MKERIKQFVDDLNRLPLLIDTPIVAFQFVSIDNANNGKMVWWEYVHSGAHSYNNAVTALITDDKTGNKILTKTLINWEYKKNVFWYEKLGNGNIIENISQTFIDNFGAVTERIDATGVEREQCNDDEKCVLLLEWEDILRKEFECKGSTMWVSFPHKENKNTIVYSSIFCVFNKHLKHDTRVAVYRLFRDFIINYLIKLYSGSEIVTTKQPTSSTEDINDYKPNYIFSNQSRTGKFDIKQHFENLCKHFFTEYHLDDFKNIKDQATLIIKAVTFDDNKMLYNGNKFSAISFPEPKNIKTKEQFITRHTYGRYLMLGLCLVHNKTVNESFDYITENSRSLAFNQINQYFKISGFKDCKLKIGNNNGLQNGSILPCLSKKERAFLYDCATEKSHQQLLVDLKPYFPK